MHFDNQLRDNLNYLEQDQIEQIYQAYLFADHAHLGQVRDDGERYITHPVAVAAILADMRMDYQGIIAAILHDVLEDTPITKEQIATNFDKTIAQLVDGITKLTKIKFSSKAESQAQGFRKMFLAMSQDIRVILIKLADRLHNMRTIGNVTPHKRYRISKETLEIYAPIANRLSMHNMYTELENRSFQAMYPHRFEVLQKALEQAQLNHHEVTLTLETEINKAFIKGSLKNSAVTSRKKHLYGIYKKMLHNRTSFINIMDVHAFRVVVDTTDDCYRALGIVHSLYKPMPGKFKDYIAIPKSNGYQSLHTVLLGPHGIPIEIQIRTQAMDQMANHGIAAHWSYKTNDKPSNTTHLRAQQWVNNLLEMQQNTTSSIEFIENVKVDLFPDEVYVFTPKGNIIELPRGATAVDFAYAIHTDIGNTCVATRIDHRFLPLSTVLSTGQIVSIITSPNSKPNPIWLNFVTTGKARSSIRDYLKNQKRSELIAFGKKLLEKSLTELQSSIQNIEPPTLKKFLKTNNLKTLDDLYEDIGLGNQLAVFVAHQLINITINKNTFSNNQQDKTPLLIRGADGIAVTFANCCYPIPGDSIIGIFNKGHGLDIHKADCVHLVKLRKQEEKCLPVLWADDVHGHFRAALYVEMIHKRGSLAELTKAIAQANASIDDISIHERSGEYGLVSLHVLVKNTSHLERVMRFISNTPITMGVTRKRGN